MPVRYFILLLLLASPFILPAQNFPSGFIAQEVAEGLNPTTMAIAPDGRLYIAQKNGEVLIFDGEQLLESPFISVEVDVTNERGLSGIAFHPEYEQNQYFYLYYTVPGQNRNRLSRFISNGDAALPGSEEILMEFDQLSGTIHNGGAMQFGPDGKLYLATGDGANPDNGQNLNSLLGKVLRLNDDGSIPEDNPFYGSLSGDFRAIYALGFRNPFTIDISEGGKLFANDVGQETYEEVNQVLAGGNYGWPLIEGPRQGQSPPANYQDPFFSYSHDDGCAILGAAFYNPATRRFPDKYDDQFFFADYCEGYIKVINPSTGALTETFATNINRPLAMEFRDDGQMYLLERAGIGGGSATDNQSSNDGALWLVSFVDNGKPFIGKQPESLTVPVGETAGFQVSASGDSPLTYAWTVNGIPVGGDEAALQLVDVQLADNGSVIQCTVSNASGSVQSATAILTVTANRRPEPVILSPATSLTYSGGDIITFSGSATDPEDGTVDEDGFTWWIDFHHDNHSHPALDPVTGMKEGTFTIPTVGETSSNVWFRIYLQVTDSEGLTQVVTREIFPNTSEVTILSDPPGLLVNVDGREVPAPYTFTGVQGIVRSVGPARAQRSGDELVVFDGWQDEFDGLSRTYFTPKQDSSILLQYVSVPVGDGHGLKGEYFNASRDFSGIPVLERIDAEVDFNWGGGSPDESVNADNFTAVWTGKIVPQFSEDYLFHVVADDGVRLYINNSLVINAWIPQAATEYTTTYSLTAGTPYDIRLEYFEDGGDAVIQLFWESATLPREVIPASQMFSSSVVSTEELPENDILVFPNPSAGTFQVISSLKGELVITDIQGRRLLTKVIFPGEPLTFSHFKPGVYLILHRHTQGTTLRKVIIH